MGDYKNPIGMCILIIIILLQNNDIRDFVNSVYHPVVTYEVHESMDVDMLEKTQKLDRLQNLKLMSDGSIRFEIESTSKFLKFWDKEEVSYHNSVEEEFTTIVLPSQTRNSYIFPLYRITEWVSKTDRVYAKHRRFDSWIIFVPMYSPDWDIMLNRSVCNKYSEEEIQGWMKTSFSNWIEVINLE